jgi:hypothetical protein
VILVARQTLGLVLVVIAKSRRARSKQLLVTLVCSYSCSTCHFFLDAKNCAV